jgi:transcriptional regulator of aromatic amino acid metabolism
MKRADRTSRELGVAPAPLGEEVLALLQGYGFPGNVRQLRRILEQALRVSGGTIRPENISLQA